MHFTHHFCSLKVNFRPTSWSPLRRFVTLACRSVTPQISTWAQAPIKEPGLVALARENAITSLFGNTYH